MADPVQADAAPRWLDEAEAAAWRSYLQMTHLLQRELDGQLQRDARMPHTYYGILARLSDQSPAPVRVTDIAADLDYSQSRTSHAPDAAGERRMDRAPAVLDRPAHHVHRADGHRPRGARRRCARSRAVRAENFLDHLTAGAGASAADDLRRRGRRDRRRLPLTAQNVGGQVTTDGGWNPPWVEMYTSTCSAPPPAGVRAARTQ